MPEFQCTRCGKCCVNFGRYVTIERNLGPGDFFCRFQITGELFRAHLDPAFRALFEEKGAAAAHPEWCTFLRKDPEAHGFVCTIHATRPPFCRSFRCYAMKIFSRDGTEIGTVGGNRALLSKDADLARCWQERVTLLTDRDEGRWRERVLDTLSKEGYRVEIYS
ncbi:MAG: YkgJ family cysteine cluster protein [Methanomicrobiales archaeon]|nr:YkgJ family cysteine cluster protein [Methanomicrobiales archaeon]MDD1644814.1 YkgJ family cysteine cluster protein [Methanomicrobiales archaeon]